MHLIKLGCGKGDKGVKKGERPWRRTLTNLLGDIKHLRETSQIFIGNNVARMLEIKIDAFK